MKIFWKDLVAFSPDGAAGGGAGGGQGGGSAGGQSDGGQQGGGGQQGAGDQGGGQQGQQGGAQSGGGQQPRNLLEAARQHAGGQQGDQGQQGGQQQGGDQQGQQMNGKPYLPDGLPEALRGASDRETIDKLYGEISSRPAVPATAKDYKYEFGEDFTKKFGDLKDDPVLPMWSEICHELGIDNKRAQDAVPKLFEKMAEAGLIAEPFDAEKEFGLLEPNEKDPTRRAAKAVGRINAVASTLQGLETRKILTKADNARLSVMMLDAANVTAFEKIIKLLPAEHGPQGGGGGGGNTGLTKDSVVAAMNDPRYDSLSPKYDPNYRKQVDADWRRVHGAA